MKKLLILLALMLGGLTAQAQNNWPPPLILTSAPVGACANGRQATDISATTWYYCSGSTWHAVVGGGGGGSVFPSELPSFVPGTNGTDFNIQFNVDDVTFNLPDAGCVVRGVVSDAAQAFCGNKTFQGDTLMDGSLYVTDYFSTDHPIEITGEACAVSEANVGLFGFDPDTGTPCFSYDGSAPAEISTGGGGGTTVTIVGNGLTSGGGITWTGNLNFTVAAAEYLIAGTDYSSAQTDLTLTAADGANPRIDIFVVQDDGTVDFITGTPAATPAKPSYDPITQFEIGFAYVATSASVPSNFSNVDLYLENTEWTCAVSANFDCASTSNPFAGTKDIKGTNAAAGNYFTLTKPAAGTENLSGYTTLSSRVRTDVAWPNAKSIVITALNGTTQIGTGVTLDNGTFGFNHATTGSYQIVAIPVSLFNTGNALITTFKGTVAGGGAALSAIYFDNVLLQGGANGGSDGTVRFVDQEIPSGAINDANTTYTLSHVPNPSSSLVCVLNGLSGLQAAAGDYTVSLSTITYANAPLTGDRLWCSYRY